jgi:hypothetical protein
MVESRWQQFRGVLRPALMKGRCRAAAAIDFGVSPLVKGKLEAF